MPKHVIPPAQGFSFLTWAQIEQIDAELKRVAEYARSFGCQAHLVLTINENGWLINSGAPMACQRLRPTIQ